MQKINEIYKIGKNICDLGTKWALKMLEETNQQLYLKALQGMKEDDFTKNIIKPLFEAMGFYRVDFYGGPYESGKDLIAFYQVPLKKPLAYAIQSKKIGEGANTSEKAILGDLIFQLRQCFLKTIKLHDGTEIKADEVYLASPYQINLRLINEIHELLNHQDKSIEILDGPMVIAKLKEFKPDLLESLLSVKDKLQEQEVNSLKNIELMSALNQRSAIHELNCYSDLAFFMGTIDSNILLNSNFTITKEVISLTKSEWDIFEKKVYAPLLKSIQFEPLIKKADVILSTYKQELKVYHSKENNDIKKGIEQANQLINDNLKDVKNILAEIEAAVNNVIAHDLKNINLDLIKKSGVLLRACIENNFSEDIVSGFMSFSLSEEISKLAEKNKQSIFHKLKDAAKKIRNLQLQISELDNLKKEYKEEPRITVYFNHSKITDWLKEQSSKYNQSICTINDGNTNHDIVSFLTETQKTLNVLDIFINKLEDSHKYIIVTRHEKKHIDGLSVSPFKLFDSQYDIAVYGGAGAGKTTTLQMYVRKVIDEGKNIIFYLPLNRYINKVNMNIDLENKNYNILLSVILMSKSIPDTKDNKEKLISFLRSSGNIKMVFDGLDEAFVKYPGVIEAIHTLKINFPDIQILISSRDCVSYLSEIDFLGITLLPFSESQLYKFIKTWFNQKDKSLAQSIISNIESKRISDIVRTPLLATLLCDLAEKGIDIPSSESEIFNKRLELLCGSYDSYKKIIRTDLSQSILIKASQKIAYALHARNQRSASKEELVKFLLNEPTFNFEGSTCQKAVNELIDPCNILFYDSISETYSFGHLRYQEHLASLELIQNRSIEIIHYLKNDWWRGALCLYAQACEFSILLEQFILRYTNIKPALITLRAMVKSRPLSEQRTLYDLIDNYERSDDNFYDDIEDWSDNWRPNMY